jgi:hypothetical protein
MIITARDDALFLVDQNEHGRIAGELCERWGNESFAAPEPREGTLFAAAMHDEGWREADDEVRFNAEQGRPLHFLEIDLADHVELYRSGVERAVAADAYGGLLVSMHWTGLYRSRWGVQDASVFAPPQTPLAALLSEVVDVEERRWIELKRVAGAGSRRSDFEVGLWHNYEVLQAHDVLSLYACTAVLRPAGAHGETLPVVSTLATIEQSAGVRTIDGVPTRPGFPRVQLRLTSIEPGVVAVDPFPFSGDSLALSVAARVIPHRRYASAEEARAAVAAGERERIDCELRRA